MAKINYTKRNVSDFTDAKYQNQILGRFLCTKILYRLFYSIEYSGKENIPTDRNYIAAPNHISLMDPVIVGEAINEPIAYMGKKELFDSNRAFAWLLDQVACFAVNREKLEVSTIKTAINVLKTPKWRLGIFPQGGIKRNKKIEKINKGVAIIAKQMKTDIVPIGITGCETPNWIPFKGKIKIKIGEPISHNQEVDDILNEWGEKIAELTGYEYVKETEEIAC